MASASRKFAQAIFDRRIMAAVCSGESAAKLLSGSTSWSHTRSFWSVPDGLNPVPSILVEDPDQRALRTVVHRRWLCDDQSPVPLPPLPPSTFGSFYPRFKDGLERSRLIRNFHEEKYLVPDLRSHRPAVYPSEDIIYDKDEPYDRVGASKILQDGLLPDWEKVEVVVQNTKAFDYKGTKKVKDKNKLFFTGQPSFLGHNMYGGFPSPPSQSNRPVYRPVFSVTTPPSVQHFTRKHPYPENSPYVPYLSLKNHLSEIGYNLVAKWCPDMNRYGDVTGDSYWDDKWLRHALCFSTSYPFGGPPKLAPLHYYLDFALATKHIVELLEPCLEDMKRRGTPITLEQYSNEIGSSVGGRPRVRLIEGVVLDMKFLHSARWEPEDYDLCLKRNNIVSL